LRLTAPFVVAVALSAFASGCAKERSASGGNSVTVALRCADTVIAYAPRDSVPIVANVRGARAAVVEFFVNGKEIGRDATAPYEAIWRASDLGTARVEAIARESNGEVMRSAPIDVVIAPLSLAFQELNGDDIGADLKTGKEPAVLLSSPDSGTVFCQPGSISLVAAVKPVAAAIDHVDFEVDGRAIATIRRPPFAFRWSNASSGRHAIAVRATDTEGRIGVTARSMILVAPAPVGHHES
jgi:hypothetical protein